MPQSSKRLSPGMSFPIGIMLVLLLLRQPGLLQAEEQLPAPADWPTPASSPMAPGSDYIPPIVDGLAVEEDAPQIFEHSSDAGPDQSFLLVGSGLTDRVFVWGRAADSLAGCRWAVKTPLAKPDYLAATLPDRSLDSLFLVWVRNQAGWSRPIRLNVPQPWWYWPPTPTAGQELRIFGRDLSRRPDQTTALACLANADRCTEWLQVRRADKYTVTVVLPKNLQPDTYQLWVHAGCGGRFGWGKPLRLTVSKPISQQRPVSQLATATPGQDGPDLQQTLDQLAADGGGVLKLGPGVFPFRGTLRVPAKVTLAGSGRDVTRLQLQQSEPHEFARIGHSGWGLAPGGLHTPGDVMEYRLAVPTTGTWTVWLRYATEMSAWKQDGVSGKMSLQLDDQEPVLLQNLPNTGSFGTFKWSRSAALQMSEGEHRLRWQNVGGGGISLDAYVFSLDPQFEPVQGKFPEPGNKVLVLQGEDVTRFSSKDGSLPGQQRSAVWLAGDQAAVQDLTISGTPQVSEGVVVSSPDPLGWLRGCRVERCRIADLERKGSAISAVRLYRAEAAIVRGNELWGRTPLYLSGVRHSNLSNNRLVSVTRFGGNSEAAIQGRNEVIEECVIEGNAVACPPSAQAGGPKARRLIWVSTGRGSITQNWFAGNGIERPSAPGAAEGAGQMRFGGVAGTEQNVGEMILFEANHRTMFFGPLADADAQSVTLPATLEPTPDERLGSVKREQLAHDAAGKETPFWPPDAWDESPEPPIGEYYVTVFRGPGWGQTRRVRGRQGERLLLDRPWRQPPAPGSLVAVGTAFYRNLIVDNYTPNGMTGVQLWISCMENVVAGNTITRMRRAALYLYSNGTTLASSMPRTWNRGISPLFFNHIEGNFSNECSIGALVISGDHANVPIEFPRAVGNVLRHNSFLRSRGDGVVLTSRKPSPEKGDTAPSILGTIVEFTRVRDAVTGYRSAAGSNGALLRRNHAYFWYPVNNSEEPPTAFRIDRPEADVVIEQNTIEGKGGELNPRYVVPLQGPQ